MNKKVAVILSGCGYLDGSEVRESVFTTLALSKRNATVSFFAPDQIIDTVDHLSNKSSNEKRNSLVESARIARGKVRDIKLAKASDFDALIIPGGFGAAQVLSNFAKKGHEAHINKDLKKLVLDFHSSNKPIGALCIAPAILALIFGDKNVKITIGNDQEIADILQKTGAQHITTPVSSACIDKELKIVTTAAYMYSEASDFDIFVGIDLCIEEVFNL